MFFFMLGLYANFGMGPLTSSSSPTFRVSTAGISSGFTAQHGPGSGYVWRAAANLQLSDVLAHLSRRVHLHDQVKVSDWLWHLC